MSPHYIVALVAYLLAVLFLSVGMETAIGHGAGPITAGLGLLILSFMLAAFQYLDRHG